MDRSEIELTLSAVDLLRSIGMAAPSRLDVKPRVEKALDGYTVVADQPQLPDMTRELRRSTRSPTSAGPSGWRSIGSASHCATTAAGSTQRWSC